MTRAATILMLVGSVAVLPAQQLAPTQGGPAFEVVSIKRSAPDAAGGSIGAPPGRFVMLNMDIRPLIGSAYGGDVDTSDYIGLPGWATTERYDGEARAPEGARPADFEPMLRTLLADRFAFTAHVETREQSVYELVRANPAGPLSPNLARVSVDCQALREARRRGEKPDLKPLDNGLFPCDISMSGGSGMEIRSGGMTMADLARSIQGGTGRILVDKTGLEGSYAFNLTYTANPRDGDVPSLFTALQEQLGLKLQSATAPVRVLVVDSIQRPTGN